MHKHLQSWSPCTGVWTQQIISDFPQKVWLRMRKPSNLCAEPVCHSFPDCNQKCPVAFELLKMKQYIDCIFSARSVSVGTFCRRSHQSGVSSETDWNCSPVSMGTPSLHKHPPTIHTHYTDTDKTLQELQNCPNWAKKGSIERKAWLLWLV